MSRTQTPIDLSVAYRIARGRNQKLWLEEMLTPAGLHGDVVYSPPLWRRMHAFLDRLFLAGYVIQRLAFGPLSYGRFVITGYVPAAVPLLALLRADAGNNSSDRPATMRYGELLAWVDHAAPEVVYAASAIAPWFAGSLEELFAVAPGIALRPGRFATGVEGGDGPAAR